MQAVADYAADVLGTDVSKLERSGNIDRFRVAKDLLLVGVAGVGSNVTDPARRIDGIDDIDSWLTVFVNWNWAFNLGAEKVLDGANDVDATGCDEVLLKLPISRASLLVAEGTTFPIGCNAAIEGSDATTNSLVVINGAAFSKRSPV
jgi:hypothetical protein